MNIGKKVGAFTKAVVKHVVSGFQEVDDEVYNNRFAICILCPKYEPSTNPTCKVCGCFLKIKARWKTSNCPLGKWPGDSSTQNISEADCGCTGSR